VGVDGCMVGLLYLFIFLWLALAIGEEGGTSECAWSAVTFICVNSSDAFYFLVFWFAFLGARGKVIRHAGLPLH